MTARVTLDPPTFTLVEFDPDELVALIERLLDDVGLSGPVTLRVDQTTPLGHVRVESLDPIVLFAESGALEDPKRIRKLSPEAAAQVLGRLLLRVRDRLDPAFAAGGAPPEDGELTLRQSSAWDAYCVGRLVRLGHRYQDDRQRRLYQFRTRHGFSDAADAAFEALWSGEGLAWADIDRLSNEAALDTVSP